MKNHYHFLVKWPYYYFLVKWPYSQMIMEKDWFDECSLADPEAFGYSAYFVPVIYENEFIEEINKLK